MITGEIVALNVTDSWDSATAATGSLTTPAGAPPILIGARSTISNSNCIGLSCISSGAGITHTLPVHFWKIK